MKIKTGKGTIPLITLIAIWSISALTSLPGLAVSPILGDLTKNISKSYGSGYSDVDFVAIVADYPFYIARW